MAQPKIIEEKPITMVQLKADLEKNKKNLGELNFRATKTEEYLDQFLEIKVKDGEELIKSLNALKIPRLRDAHIYKIIDLMPTKVDLVKLLFQGTPLTISEDSCKKIVKVVEEHLPKQSKKEETKEEAKKEK